MVEAGSSVIAATRKLSLLAFLVPAICAASVEVYPGPGMDTYKSSRYQVEISDGVNWLPAYVYGFSRSSVTYWHTGTSPSVNFLTFGTTGQVPVRVAKIGGSITSIDVSPHSENIPVTLTGGKAVLTLGQWNKVWITINGDDANPLFIFRNISLEGTQKYLSEIKGWDANNGFHDVLLENVTIHGTKVTSANVASYFDINSFVWGLSYAPFPPAFSPRRRAGW